MAVLCQDFPFGFDFVPVAERLRAVKAAGFDEVMIHWQAEEGHTARERYAAVRQAGLGVRTAHFPQERMADLWREGEDGDALEAQLLTAIREAGSLGVENLVMHTTRRLETPPPNPTGVRRVWHAVEAAEKAGIFLALENTRFLHYNQYLFERIASPFLTFCYDCGHAHCFTPEEDPLALFGSRMTTMHLHDNHGLQDEHLLIGEGNINLEALFARLAAFHPASYNLESRCQDGRFTLETYLATAFSRLKACVERAERALPVQG